MSDNKKFFAVATSILVFLSISLLIFEFAYASSNEYNIIEDWYDLNQIRNDLDSHYVLANDLDKDSDGYDELIKDNSDGWQPIGSAKHNSFSGTFDGNGSSISDLYIIDRSRNTGFFDRIVDKGDVKNVEILNSVVEGKSNVGILAGSNNGHITNVSISGNVSGDNGIGGLVGYNDEHGIIKNTNTEVKVLNTSINTGGLVGRCFGKINNSYSQGEVQGTENVGGLIGFNDDGTILTDSYSNVSVQGSTNIGGLIGINGGDVRRTYTISEVHGTENTGGLIGNNRYFGYVTSSLWNLNTTLQNESEGGRGKTSTELKKFETYQNLGWNITEIKNDEINKKYTWNIKNESYPFLSSTSKMDDATESDNLGLLKIFIFLIPVILIFIIIRA